MEERMRVLMSAALTAVMCPVAVSATATPTTYALTYQVTDAYTIDGGPFVVPIGGTFGVTLSWDADDYVYYSAGPQPAGWSPSGGGSFVKFTTHVAGFADGGPTSIWIFTGGVDQSSGVDTWVLGNIRLGSFQGDALLNQIAFGCFSGFLNAPNGLPLDLSCGGQVSGTMSAYGQMGQPGNYSGDYFAADLISISEVPEPGTLALLGLGLAGLGLSRRRKAA